MYECVDKILGRRSVRAYSEKAVEPEMVQKLIEACFYAPTAMNVNPRQLIVIDDREKLDEIVKAHPYAKFVADAPLAFVVCGDDSLKGKLFWRDDAAASTQNILAAAAAMGLGSCWCGIHPTPLVKTFRKLFNVPAGIIPYSLVVVGHVKEGYTAHEIKRDLVGTVHKNNW